MAQEALQVAGFAGSLRKGSVNRLLLHAAMRLAPGGIAVTELDISAVPLFNEDEETAGPPEAAVRFKEAVAAADGLLIVTPEYNSGTTAVTKNLLDWASRRSRPGNVLTGKPVAIMSMSGGPNGIGMYARAQVRQTILFPGAVPMPRWDVGAPNGAANFDEAGNLINEALAERITQAMARFADWIRLVAPWE
ncbi:MAG: NAD(P)H-dependent oxidoreductase [Chloroflexota bacterium]|nr:NAD(P)H-dependent oxidoreductase [Chloroflexota bacterium]